ncbi:Tryptophan synthase alpha chain [bacterium HR39]|nr:Tryptophan synthase alpha chain [bacterium HR39]
MRDRITERFAELAREGRAGLVTFLVAGDPDMATFEDLLAALPEAGADVLEVGMPFSDPMADGPAIEAGYQRALRAGTRLRHVLQAVERFRRRDPTTPVVLMGYYNPIYRYGVERFVEDARAAGVDGLIVVDLPPEEDGELRGPAREAGLHFVRLVAPTSITAPGRLPRLVESASGFLYYISFTGVTGAREPDLSEVEEALAAIRRVTELPVAVGFGIREPVQAAAVARLADAVVVGSALVRLVAAHLDEAGRPRDDLRGAVVERVRALAAAVHGAERNAGE